MKQICQIPRDSASAIENMAIDATMLEFGNTLGEAMWRTYGWTEQAVTFGYSQEWNWIQLELSSFEGSRVRRLTGGGIVDHRHDLTYALSIPKEHPFYRKPALEIYLELHEHIANILMERGFPAQLAPCEKACEENRPATLSGVCFQSAEPYDVIHPLSGNKLAGAAIKRNQSGILIQGSLDLAAMSGLTPSNFERDFGKAMALWLDLSPTQLTGTLPADVLLRELERFGSEEWNQRR